MPESVERCVKEVEKQPGVKDPWAICMSQYKKTQEKKKRKNAEINNKLRNKLNKLFNNLDK